ncbi:hypothetical protein Bca4012_035123 [Brassica carinata]
MFLLVSCSKRNFEFLRSLFSSNSSCLKLVPVAVSSLWESELVILDGQETDPSMSHVTALSKQDVIDFKITKPDSRVIQKAMILPGSARCRDGLTTAKRLLHRNPP